MVRNRTRQPKILLGSSHQDATGERLPRFEPHDLRSLVNEARASKAADFGKAFLSAFRQRNREQIDELLQSLGVERSQPDVWERAFFLLAFYHHGLGQIGWSPRRTNKNAAAWTRKHDMVLLKKVTTLMAKGASERAAIREIAANPAYRKEFPFRNQRHRVDKQRLAATTNEMQKRQMALRSRLRKVKSSATLTSLGNQLFGALQPDLNPVESALYHLDRAHLGHSSRSTVGG
jgi:hypothetical protein